MNNPYGFKVGDYVTVRDSSWQIWDQFDRQDIFRIVSIGDRLKHNQIYEGRGYDDPVESPHLYYNCMIRSDRKEGYSYLHMLSKSKIELLDIRNNDIIELNGQMYNIVNVNYETRRILTVDSKVITFEAVKGCKLLSRKQLI